MRVFSNSALVALPGAAQDPEPGWKSVQKPVWRVDDLLKDDDHWCGGLTPEEVR
jgi:hypothetical protein